MKKVHYFMLPIIAYFSLFIFYLIKSFISSVFVVGAVSSILLVIFYIMEFLDTRKENSQNAYIRSNNGNSFRIKKTDFRKACIWGGLFAGILGTTIIFILFFSRYKEWTGYSGLDKKQFLFEIIFGVFIFQTALGTILGWLFGNFVLKISFLKKRPLKRVFYLVFIFIIGFITIFTLRQLMSRDALVKHGTALSYINDYQELKKENPCKVDSSIYSEFRPNTDSTKKFKYVRHGGGLLGEPDFESLATGLTGAAVFIILILAITKLFTHFKQRSAILSIKGISLISLKASCVGFIVWLMVYEVYLVLIKRCIIAKFGVIGARWIFAFDFPNPQRLYLIFSLCLVYLLCFLFSIRIFFKKNIPNGKTQNKNEIKV